MMFEFEKLTDGLLLISFRSFFSMYLGMKLFERLSISI